ERAKGYCDSALKLEPDNKDTRLLAATIAWFLKDYAEMEKICQALFLETPASFGASNYLALALAEQADKDKRRRALELAELNVRLYPNSGEALTTYALAAYRQDKLDDAERACRTALNTRGSSDCAFYLARLLADRGENAEAARIVKLALEAPGQFAFRK